MFFLLLMNWCTPVDAMHMHDNLHIFDTKSKSEKSEHQKCIWCLHMCLGVRILCFVKTFSQKLRAFVALWTTPNEGMAGCSTVCAYESRAEQIMTYVVGTNNFWCGCTLNYRLFLGLPLFSIFLGPNMNSAPPFVIE